MVTNSKQIESPLEALELAANGLDKGILVEKDLGKLVTENPMELKPFVETPSVVKGEMHVTRNKEEMKRQLIKERPEVVEMSRALGEQLKVLESLPVQNRPAGHARPYEYIQPDWKRKLNKIRKYLRDLSTFDPARKGLKLIADYKLKGDDLDLSEAVEILADAYRQGLFPNPGEVKEVESEIGASITGDESFKPAQNTVNPEQANPEQKISESENVDGEPEVFLKQEGSQADESAASQDIPVPEQKMSSTISLGKIKIEERPEGPITREVLSDISGQTFKKSDLLEKTREELPQNFFETEALRSFRNGEIGDALVYVEKIEDDKIQADTVGEMVDEAVRVGDFSLAKKLIPRIRDEGYEEELFKWFSGILQGNPTVERANVITEENDKEVEKSEEVTQPSASKKNFLEPEVVSAPLNIKKQYVDESPIILDETKVVKSKIVIPDSSYSKRSITLFPNKKSESDLDVREDIQSKTLEQNKLELDNKIRELREKITLAEKVRDEAKVVDFENQLRMVERQKIQLDKVSGKSDSNLDLKIKEQIEKVKKAENADEASYVEELSKLRALERQRDGVRAPKSNISDAVPIVESRINILKEPEVLVQKTPEIIKESKEKLDEELKKAREEYAKLYIDWETKSRIGKRMFAKTLLELGTTRPTPARLSSKTPEMEEAKREYLKAIENSGINIESDSRKLILSERLLLENRLQEIRMEKSNDGDVEAKKDANILSKAVQSWNKKTRKQKLAVTAVVLTGGLVGAIAEVGYEGLRVDRNESIDKNLSKIPPPESLPEIEHLPTIKAPEGFEFIPIKKIDTRIKEPEVEATAPNVSEPAPEVPIHVEQPIKSEPEQIVEEEVIPVSDKDIVAEENAKNITPEAISTKTINEHVPYGSSFVDIVHLDNGARAVKYNGMEIAHEYDLGGQKLFSLDDQFQEDGKFLEIRGAFSAFLKENLPKMGIGIEPIGFNGGVINIVSDPSSEERLLVLLNGKVIGVGDNTKQKVKIETLKELRKAWFLESEYEKACKEANRALKNIYNKIPILNK